MKFRKFWLILWLVFSAATVGFLFVSQFLPRENYWKEIKSAAQTAKESKESIVDLKESKQINEPPVNFLLMGIPGQGNDAPDLTDTILIVHFNPARQKIYLFSLPRDLLVKIPNNQNYAKFNALYALAKKDAGHEFDLIKHKAEEISGLSIDHYALVDLTVVKNSVDILGGVNVMVKKDICDERFPGPNHSYQTFEIKAGWRYLDGETALKYIRSRHSAIADFDRITRQQEVLQALKQKILNLKIWQLAAWLEIYENFSSHIKTDLSLWQGKKYWDKTKDIPGENIIKSEINRENLIVGGQATLGGETASVLKPKAGLENYEEIKEYIKKIIQ